MRTVFGVDVSKASSEVAIVINGEKIHGYTMPNDAIGFTRLLDDLKTVQKQILQKCKIGQMFFSYNRIDR